MKSTLKLCFVNIDCFHHLPWNESSVLLKRNIYLSIAVSITQKMANKLFFFFPFLGVKLPTFFFFSVVTIDIARKVQTKFWCSKIKSVKIALSKYLIFVRRKPVFSFQGFVVKIGSTQFPKICKTRFCVPGRLSIGSQKTPKEP